MKALVLMLRQDDPFKCTAAKLVKFGLIREVRYVRKDTLILNPLADILLSRKDLKISSSICAIDCSWKQARNISRYRHFGYRGIDRRLPLLLAANPINYAKVGLLSTAEALAGALYILGYRIAAEEFMNKFRWGHTFLELNHDVLEDYANVENPKQIGELEQEYFPHLY
jgi:pre-rRNA-processing protein TSR3